MARYLFKLKHLIVALLILIVSAPATHAAEALELEADSADYNKQTGVAVYRGNVKISRGDIKLEGDVVEVHTVDNEVTKLIATANSNPSRLMRGEQQQMIKAEAQRIEYKVPQGIVDFSGRVKIKEADRLLTGDHAIYHVGEKTVTMKKKKNRVKLTIEPKKKAQ